MTKKEHYKLCLKEFEVNLSKNCRELREDEDFCDVTLACEDKQIEAHKVILSGSSPMFKDLLKRNPHPHPLIYLRGIKYGHLVNLLDFIYTGEAKITSEELDVFLSMAHELQVKGLTEEGQENEEVLKSEVKQEVIQKDNEDSLEDGNSSVLSNLKQFKEPVIEKDVEEKMEQSLKSDEISSVSSKRKCMSDDENVENKIQKIHETPKYSEPLQSSIDDVQNNLNYFTGFTNLEKSKEDPTPSSFSENSMAAETEKPMGIFAKFQQVLKYNDSNLPQSSVQNDDRTLEPENDYISSEEHDENEEEELNPEMRYNSEMYPYPQYYPGQFVQNALPMGSMPWQNFMGNSDYVVNSDPQEMINQNSQIKDNNDTAVHLNEVSPWVSIKSEKPNDYETAPNDNTNDYETTPASEKSRHEAIEYSLNNNLNTCSKCNLKFTTKTNLDEHTKCMHNGDQNLTITQNIESSNINKEENKMESTKKAESIKKAADSTRKAKASEKIKIKSELILKSCEKCDFVTTQSHVLSNHKKTVHEGVGFACEQCNFKGTQKTSLRRHVLSVHEKVRYSCELCDYSATQKPILNKHLRVKH